MNRPATFSSRRVQATWVTHAWGLAAGVGFTSVIAAGLAYFSQSPAAEPEPLDEEILAVEIPEPPPPPPPLVPQPGATLPPAPLVFEEAPSSSSVRIAPTPIPIVPLKAEIRPTFSLRFDFSPGQFRPDSGNWEPDVNHVFQRSDVDQQVVPVFKKAPKVSSALLDEVPNTRVRVLFVVNTDGTVENVRLLKGAHPEFDRLVIEAIREWRFRPAIRKGKKVRCMTELPVYIKPPRANPFGVD